MFRKVRNYNFLLQSAPHFTVVNQDKMTDAGEIGGCSGTRFYDLITVQCFSIQRAVLWRYLSLKAAG